MNKTILVPTDFSDCSAAAYSYAALMAEKMGAIVCLLHVLDIPPPSLSSSGQKETRMDTHFMMEMMQLTKARMNKIRSGKVFENVEVKEVVEVGPVLSMIQHAIKKQKADMIVMGTHGVSGLQEKFIGTNAEKIVRSVEIPVLSVKHFVKNPRIETILFATDFSKESETVFPAVGNLAAMLKAKLVLTKVITPAKFETTADTEKQVEKFRAKNKSYAFSAGVYYANSKEEGIRRSADAQGANMIALGTHGRNGIAHFFRGSIAEDVVSHASLPVLTVNFKKTQQVAKTKIQTRKVRQYDSDLLYQIPSV